MPKEKNESDAESFQTGASGEAGVKPAETRVNFPKWKCEKGTKYGEYNKEGWSGHVMKVKAYCNRMGYRNIYAVAEGKKDLSEFEHDASFAEANDMLFWDLVLTIEGPQATEILQSSNETFTDAWAKLMREFGQTTSVRRMDIIRNLVQINMNNEGLDMYAYKSKCMKLSRQIKESEIKIEDVIIYSVLYGLDERFEAYKLIPTQP